MKIISISCYHCGKIINKYKNEYDRQLRNGREYFYCSLSCSTKNTRTIHTPIRLNCLFCHTTFETTTHKKAKKCCSLDCAHKYSQSFVDPSKISESIKKSWQRGDYDDIHGRVSEPRVYNFTCIICKIPFQRITKKFIRPLKTCSKECYHKLIRQWTRNNPNCGGDTGYRRYKYNDILMDSKWEVEIAKWMDDNQIKWERSRKQHMLWWTDDKGNKRRYYPDFYLPELKIYLDPKNKYKMELDRSKIEQVIKENNITLYWGLLHDIKNSVNFSINKNI